jgi:hypothetical protein
VAKESCAPGFLALHDSLVMKFPPFLLFLAAVFVFPATNLRAGTFVVTNNTDSDAGSLRAALLAAEATVGEDDVITFQNTLSGAVIDISPTGQFSLSAAGRILVSAAGLAQPVTINGLGVTRIFEVGPGVELELNDLVLAEGSAAWGTPPSDGVLPTDGGDGENGGGILNEGELILKRCVIQFCLAGNGSRGGHKSGAGPSNPGNGGDGGKGGAIYSTGAGASVSLEDCVLTDNEAGSGGQAGNLEAGAVGTIGTAGLGGDGGAIACEGGSLEMIRTAIESNRAGAGGGGGANGNGGTGGTGGIGGNGGGVSVMASTLHVSGSSFKNNNAGLGGLGGDVDVSTTDTRGAGGKGGDGGGLWARDIALGGDPHVEESLFQGNEAGNGRVGGNSPGPGNGGVGTAGGKGGSGGGVYVAGGNSVKWTMVNSTVILNFAGDGGSGGSGTSGGSAGPGGDAGSGGGLAFSRNGTDYTAQLTHVTILSNNAGLPGSAGTPDGAIGAASTGGGIWEIAGGINSVNGIILANAVVALNDAGTVDNVGSFIAVGNNFTAGDPEVGVLADNGGPTETVAPELGSPLLDGGGTIGEAPLVDQRGEVRPFNGAPDLGAFEAKFQPDARIGVSSNPATHRIDNFYSPTGASQALAVKLTGTKTSTFYLSAQNDGEIEDHLTLTGTSAGKTIRLTAIRTTGGVANVTAALAAGYEIESVAPGAVNVIQVSVKAASKKVRAKQTLVYGVRSSVTSPVDAVIANISQKKVRKKR